MTANSRIRQNRAKKLLAAQRGLCARCHLPIRRYGGLEPEDGTLDHVIPRSKGGKNVIENLLVMHRQCNERKADKAFRAGDFHAAVLRRLEQTEELPPR